MPECGNQFPRCSPESAIYRQDRFQDPGESLPYSGCSFRRSGDSHGIQRIRGMVPCSAAAHKPRDKCRPPLGVLRMASETFIFMEVIQGTFLVRFKTDAFRTHRYIVQEHIHTCHREDIQRRQSGTLYQGASICGFPVIQPDRDNAEGDLPCTVQHPGRRCAAE